MNRVIQKKAVEYGKLMITKHEGNGCFSTEYYIHLFDKYVERYFKSALS